MNKNDITNLAYWESVAPCTYIFKYNNNIGFLLIILDLCSEEDDWINTHPYGFADLYIASTFTTRDKRTNYVSDLITENKTITFCLEIASSVIKEWEKEGLF